MTPKVPFNPEQALIEDALTRTAWLEDDQHFQDLVNASNHLDECVAGLYSVTATTLMSGSRQTSCDLLKAAQGDIRQQLIDYMEEALSKIALTSSSSDAG